MQPKYYTPTLDEFRQGFQYEVQNADGLWMSHTYNFGAYLPEDLLKIRVRYLNESDILALKFTFEKDTSDIGKLFYKTYAILNDGVSLSFQIRNEIPFISLWKDSNGDKNWDYLIQDLHIRNINELEWLLNRYGI